MPGLIRVFDEDYAERVERFGTFTFTTPTFEHMAARELAIVGFESWEDDETTLSHVALATNVHKVASFERLVRLSHFAEFEGLPVHELQAALPKRLRRFFTIGPLPSATWEAVLEALQRLRPSAAPEVRRLTAALHPRPLPGRVTDVLVQEKDAVGLALDLAGFDRRELTEWIPTGEVAPFLDNLPAARIREDQVLQHDSAVFGDWGLLRRNQVGAVTFERHGERLTVMNVNRTPVEAVLGVDLIYYTHRYNAYVGVQYKMFRREGSDWRYRPDEQFLKELSRMQALKAGPWNGDPDEYRLNADGRFLKFCIPETLDPLSPDLLQGSYVPVALWRAMERNGAFSGPSGGSSVSRSTLSRHLNNTDFVALCSDGWIGSRSVESDVLTKIIRSALRAKHSVVLAALVERD